MMKCFIFLAHHPSNETLAWDIGNLSKSTDNYLLKIILINKNLDSIPIISKPNFVLLTDDD